MSNKINIRRSDYREIAEQLMSCNGLEIYQVYRMNKTYKLLRATVAVKYQEKAGLEITYSYPHWHNMPSQTINESNYQVIKSLFPSIAAIYRNRVKWVH